MIDIHTHKNNSKGFFIKNLFPEDEPREPQEKQYFSIGLHPWKISEANWEKQIKLLENKIPNKKIIAIGEIGLDKLVKVPPDLQFGVFEKQLKIAEIHNLPVIIHSVKSNSEILKFRKRYSKTNWILHGFAGNIIEARALIEKQIYLSFGSAVLKSPKVADTITRIETNKIFFETDDSNLSINKVYSRAAEILKIDLEELRKIIKNNFSECFGEIINE